MNLEFDLSLNDLYFEALKLDSTGDSYEHKRQLTIDDSSWVGITTSEIEKAKWVYPREIKKQSFEDLNLLGKTEYFKYFNDEDGEDMSMERYYESLPALIQRKRKKGKNFGKFVKILVNVGEPCYVGVQEMVTKAMACVNMADIFESFGIRTEISAVFPVKNSGSYNGQSIDTLITTIPIKKFEHSMNKQLIATTLSPWMLRYWILALMAAKTNPSYGYGQPYNITPKEDEIYIGTGHMLNEGAATTKIKKLTNQITQ